MRPRRRFGRTRSGGAAVELAVVFPVLLLLIIGVVDYGRVFYTSVAVSNAARAGAEWGAQSSTTSGGPTNVTDTAGMKAFAQADGNEAGTLTVTPLVYCECGGAAHSCTNACGGGAAPDVFVKITASKSVSMFLPYPGLPSSILVSRTAIFRSQ